MLITDFEDGGFPISIHTPIICTVLREDNDDPLMSESIMAYNRYELKKIITTRKIVYLLGIWPGKRVTDGYPLKPEKYKDFPVPPERYKNIDSAIDIIIMMDKDQFSKIIYKPGPRSEDHVLIESDDFKLYEYVRKAGLKYKTVFE